MRVFWGLVLVLIVAAVGVVVLRGRGGDPLGQAEPVAAVQSPAGEVAPEAGAPEEASGASLSTPDEGGKAADAASAGDPGEEPEPRPEAVAQPEPAPSEDAVAAEAAPGGEGGAFVIESHEVAGSGTPADPYVVPWDVLTSASRTYQPREGKKDLPAWAQRLEGKHVRLTGYFLLPMVRDGADELLVMLNQWDGCCIGLPPTPYDAVEVKLRETFRPKRGEMVNYGSVEGTFRTDPYLAGDWLLGLYVLEDAKVADASSRTGEARPLLFGQPGAPF